MSDHECVRCGTKSSIFWWRHSVNCDINGNEGAPFELCDSCHIDLMKFLRGRVLTELDIRVSRRKSGMSFEINGWRIFRKEGRWVAVSEDDDQFTEEADSLSELIIKIDQIDHPEVCG